MCFRSSFKLQNRYNIKLKKKVLFLFFHFNSLSLHSKVNYIINIKN